ncbi:hypothetical protein BGZ95_002110 [Linnemannia exigua]|uniref:Uncharacterized protein n=1 Tax=Linnemannia exigua TaxID=604196 RepID=A0AAD4D5Y3_9FUNG|nr:hypothetical protein BGZ95_002110 [Linnemannia exigua]
MPKGRQDNRRRREPSEEEPIPTNEEGALILRAEDIEGFVSLEERAVRVLALISQLFGSHSVPTNDDNDDQAVVGDGNENSLPCKGDCDASVVVEAEHVSSDSTTLKDYENDDDNDGLQNGPEDQVKEDVDNCAAMSSANPADATDPNESITIDRGDLSEQNPRSSLTPPLPTLAAAQKRIRGSGKPKGFVAKREKKRSTPPRLPQSLSAAATAAAATTASLSPLSANPTTSASLATSTPSHDSNAESLPARRPTPVTKREGRPGRLRVSKTRH